VRRLLTVGLLVAAVCAADAHAARAQGSATLYHTYGPNGQGGDLSRAFLSFRAGEADVKEQGEKEDLAFGLLQIGGEDWFQVVNGSDGSGRSVIRDLGPHDWDNDLVFPALAPLPELKPGEQRTVTVDASADTHGKWAKATTTFAKVRIGHIYAVRVVRGDTDLYALFRVEAHEQNESCKITWRIVPAPAEAADWRMR